MTRDDKSSISLPTGHRILGHLDHAWASTVYSFQGITVTDNIAIMQADKNPLTTIDALYVAGSRHQDNLAIVTDDKEKLIREISEKLEIANEEIIFKEPPAPEKPVERTPTNSKTNTGNLEQSIQLELPKSQEPEKPRETTNPKTIEQSEKVVKPEPNQRERQLERERARQRSRGGRGR